MAATNVDGDVFLPTDEAASIALLRGLRAKTVDHTFIHRVDVCSAVPEELVADLQPVPGTDVTEDGYNSVWYFYCLKRYKNTRGEASGYRQRSVETAGTCWHSEAGAKPVTGVPGATLCNLSYGRMEKGPSGRKRLDRMGWNMTEFDDTQGGGGDHVLCKVHRSTSSLAKKKFKSSPWSSSSKRKAAGDHPEAPPTKLIHDEQVQVQQNNPAAFFTNVYPTMPCYGHGVPQGMDPVTMFGGEEEEHCVLQQGVEPEYGGELNLEGLFSIDELAKMHVQQDPAALFSNAYYPTMPCDGFGPVGNVDPVTMVGDEEELGVQQPLVELEAEHVDGGEFNVEELLNMEEFSNAYPTTTMPGYVHGSPQGEEEEEEEHGAQHQPRVESEAEHGGDGGFNLEELLNTDDWKGLLQMLQAKGEQGQQQLLPSDEHEQGGGIVISGGLLYAC